MQLPLPLSDLGFLDATTPPPRAERIYVNRSLRMDQVEAVGFDMDYTLAIYRQEAMDRQSIEATVEKLVKRGYPEALRHMHYRLDFAIRGLLIDRKLGNVLKMDRHRYVKKAYHGFRELTVDERREAYHTRRIRALGGRYHWVDTLYSLCEVSMFAAAIDALEREGMAVDYERLYGDIRKAVDESHQDGTILGPVLADLPRFIRKDPELATALHKLRSAGKKVFLLTNSHAPYTDTMMSHLLDGQMPAYPTWKKYFDVVVTTAKKPSFFVGSEPFLEVVGDERIPATTLERGRVYAGGNMQDFERMLGIAGDRVLYVGDHIYGDVLRAKKEGAWRTAMILQEMEEELSVVDRLRADHERLDALEEQRMQAVDELREHQSRLKRLVKKLEGELPHDQRLELEASRLRHKRAADRLKHRLEALEAEHEELERAIEVHFHPFWGSLFKCGPEVSSFGDQVEEYACLYTARASNLRHYSALHYFQSPRDRMPHEL
ncbi:MAG: HAD-IG family 5'-nucleotidase [Polyangiales bacterium]